MGLGTRLSTILQQLDAVRQGIESVNAAASFLPVGQQPAGTVTTSTAGPASLGPSSGGTITTSDPIPPDDEYVRPIGGPGPLVLLSVLEAQGEETTLDVGREVLAVWLYAGRLYPRREGARRASGTSSGGGGGSASRILSRLPGDPRRPGVGFIGSPHSPNDIRDRTRNPSAPQRTFSGSTVSPDGAAIVSAVDKLRQSVERGSDAALRLGGEL